MASRQKLAKLKAYLEGNEGGFEGNSRMTTDESGQEVRELNPYPVGDEYNIEPDDGLGLEDLPSGKYTVDDGGKASKYTIDDGGTLADEGPEFRPDELNQTEGPEFKEMPRLASKKASPLRKQSSKLVSGGGLSPEPDRPKFGPIPGLSPEQVDSVVKFASERAGPGAKMSGPVTSPQKEEAEEESGGNDDFLAAIVGAGNRIGHAIAGVDYKDDLEKSIREGGRNRVAQQEKKAKEKEAKKLAVQEFVLRKMGREQEADRLRQSAEKALRDDDYRERELAERGRHNLETEKTSAADAASRSRKFKNTGGYGKAEKQELGKTIPAAEAGGLGQLDAGDAMLDDLSGAWDKKASSWHSGASSFLPGTDAKQYDDNRLASAQSIGTILEGGKLTDSDLKDKYLPLMPSASDGKERKEAKIQLLRRMLQQKKEATISGFGSAGYNVSGFKKSEGEPTKQEGGGLSPDKKSRLEELRKKRDAGTLR